MSESVQELRKRVATLEDRLDEVVGEQQLTLSRRQALASALGIASVGAGGHHLIQPAQGAAVGQIGDSSNRVDIFAETIDATTTKYDTIEADDDLDVNSVTADNVLNVHWASQYSTLQAAITNASSGDIVVVDGSFDESISISKPITLLGGTESEGTSGIDTTDNSNPAVTVTNNGVQLFNFGIRNQGSANSLKVEGANDCTAIGCRIRGSKTVIDTDSDFARIVACNFVGEDIDVDGDNNVVRANVRTGTVSDTGTGNEVGGNT